MYRSSYITDRTYEFLLDSVSDFKSENSKKVYLSHINNLCDFTRKDFCETSQGDVIDYFAFITKKKSKRSTKVNALNIYRSLAAKYDAANGTQLLSQFTGIDMENAPKEIKTSDLPKYEAIDSLLEYLKVNNNKQMFCIISLVMETALTSSEVCRPRVENCRMDSTGKSYLSLDATTNEGRPRYFALNPELARLITEMVSEREGKVFPEDPLFVNAHGGPLSVKTLQRDLRSTCIEAGINPFTLADVRTLALVMMRKSGINVEKLSEITDNTGRWFFRLNRAVEELPNEDFALKHISFKW